ncbi:MAG: UvrD-helicase domain-containing protein [Treponema sp.]|nr:UvrD-helicase domain-containing protein [Treponema sp.]
MTEILDGLNEAQREAVTSTEGFIRVVAGAGSGKTRALAHRFAYLVNGIGVLPGHILCVTFTNKAAAEMRMRIRKITGGNDTGYISTFHSFCVNVLQEDSWAVGYPKSFVVLDNADIDQMLQIIYDERGLTLRDKTFGDARDMFEIRKTQKEKDYYKDMITLPLEAIKEKYDKAEKVDDILFYGYLYQEKKTFALDYNDLIVFVLQIFEMNEEVRRKWQERLEYVMIDEFQDIDDIQYRLMEALVAYHKNLFVVGDPDQTIYTWRGANIRYLLDFDKKFPDTKTIMMNDNYRSTPKILDVANSLISKNKNRMKKDLRAMNKGECMMPLYTHSKKQEEEAQEVCNKLMELHESGIRYSDCAILYRAHYVSRTLEELLSKNEIPYTMFSGISFFDREEVKDALSYLRMCIFKDDLSFRRIVNKPRRNIGKSRMEALEKKAEENQCTLYQALCDMVDAKEEIMNGTKAKEFIDLVNKFYAESRETPASEVMSHIINESGYERMLRTEGSQTRLDNLAELKQAVYDFEISCGEECPAEYFLAHASLLSGLDAGGSNEAVKLMTVHTAKGLEFPHVFLCGMNEGIFPSRKVRDPAAMEEERRLCFVAVTRAERSLYLYDSEGKNLDGSVRYPSRFVFDIDRNFLEYKTELSEQFTKSAKSFIDSVDRLLESREKVAGMKVGDEINHIILGKGQILEVSEEEGAFLIKFENIPTPRKIRFCAVQK